MDNASPPSVSANVTPTALSAHQRGLRDNRKDEAEAFTYNSIHGFTYNTAVQQANTKPPFKYRHKQAFPTPDGIKHEAWRRIYNNADSRKYNEFNQDSTRSTASRNDGTTRTLAEKLLRDELNDPNCDHTKFMMDNSAVMGATAGPSNSNPQNATITGSSNNTVVDSSNVATPDAANEAIASATAQEEGEEEEGEEDEGEEDEGEEDDGEEDDANDTDNADTPGATSGQTTGDTSEDDKTYCICRGKDDNTFMIQCEACDEWFHTRCINPQVQDAKGQWTTTYVAWGKTYTFDDMRQLIYRFYCDKCRVPGKRDIMFRKGCQMAGCLKPARGPKKKGDEPDPFCSNACIERWSQGVRTRMTSVATSIATLGGRLTEEEVSNLVGAASNISTFTKLGHVRPSMYKDEETCERAKLKMIAELEAIIEKETPGMVPEVDIYSLPNTAENSKKYGPIKRKNFEERQKIAEKLPKGYGYGDETFPWRVMFHNEVQALLLKNVRRLREIRFKLADWDLWLQFVRMVVRHSSKVQEEYIRTHGVKKICGYDRRICKNEAEFATYRKTKEWQDALEKGEIGDPEEEQREDIYKGVCVKSPCKKHHDWVPIQREEIKLETDNLKKEAKKLREEKIDDLWIRMDTKFAIRELPGRLGMVSNYVNE